MRRGANSVTLGAIGSIPTAPTAIIGVAMTLLDGLMRLDSSQHVSATTLEQLMAPDGRFYIVNLISADSKSPAHKYVTFNLLYSVSVGSETRSYVLVSSTYAVKSEVLIPAKRHFRTKRAEKPLPQ